MYLGNYAALFSLLQKVTKTVGDKLLSYYQVSKREILYVSTLKDTHTASVFPWVRVTRNFAKYSSTTTYKNLKVVQKVNFSDFVDLVLP